MTTYRRSFFDPPQVRWWSGLSRGPEMRVGEALYFAPGFGAFVYL